jgi:hypothetical protein
VAALASCTVLDLTLDPPAPGPAPSPVTPMILTRAKGA